MLKDYLNRINKGDCIEIMKRLPDKSVDLIFADPPYNLQLKNELHRPDQSHVDGVFDNWDKFSSFKEYDIFTINWLTECKRILKDNGTIWVIGSYHNIFRVGTILQNLNYWILNDIIWIKSNPMPNFKGTRFNNAHETLIWASKSEKSKYTFHYKSMKNFNEDLQMRSDWYLPICTGNERLKVNGEKAHSTQKPEDLLYRIIISTTNTGDVVLDPFSGSGTTAAIAKKLGRNFIGIEKERVYVEISSERIENTTTLEKPLLDYEIEAKLPKIPFGNLISSNLVKVGESLFSKDGKYKAIVLADSSLKTDAVTASIHKVSATLLNKSANNGWTFWYVKRNNELVSIDTLRSEYYEKYLK
jgi:site-specific DNA-methyltransferase (adenine-specific)/modification methylase